VTIAAERDYVRMFHDQKLIGDEALFALLDQIFLDSQRFSVPGAAQIAELAGAQLTH
jgi:hypothetical protein